MKVVSAQQQQEVKVRKGKNGAKNLLNLHNEKKFHKHGNIFPKRKNTFPFKSFSSFVVVHHHNNFNYLFLI